MGLKYPETMMAFFFMIVVVDLNKKVGVAPALAIWSVVPPKFPQFWNLKLAHTFSCLVHIIFKFLCAHFEIPFFVWNTFFENCHLVPSGHLDLRV